MPTLTVFTPTYNRAYILPKCYESLKRQTCKDFVWLIIDDGSSDGTDGLVKRWQSADNGFLIRYAYQENQGMHGAHNLAYELIDTELNTCIDSDDRMTDDAIEKIIRFWRRNGGAEDISGFLALDAYENGEIIGTKFPENIKAATSYDYYYRHGVKGDKKFILRSDLTKKNPYPLYEGEKYVNLATKYSLLDIDYKLLNMNEAVCVVEYLPDGSSSNMFRQYVRNPQGFAYSRKLCMGLPFAGFKFGLIQAVHYVSSCIISKNRGWLRESPKKALTLLVAPAGVLWWLIILIKTRN
ncbi:MAG: glycosyltransferase family 2 protein [Oscillospiraceae bacterium]|nr:glycosyltransferase family 2 protein [Oscillospiraceae bacterium]